MNASEKELRTLLGRKVGHMRAIINAAQTQNRNVTVSESEQFDKLDNEIRELSTTLGIISDSSSDNRNVRLAALEEELRKPINAVKLSNFRGSDYETRNEHEPWVNQETGEPIKVLGREQRMSDLIDTHGYEPLSIGKFIRGLATSDWKGAAAEHRAMNEGSGGAGQFLVPSPLAASIIDKMRNASVMNQAGALTVPMDSQTLSIARIAGDPTAAWHTEAATINPSDMTFEKVTFTAQTLAAICQLSVEVIEDASNIDQIVSDTLAKVLALEVDRACLRGSGTPPEIKGIRFQTGVNVDSTTFTTNGSVISNAAPTGAVGHIWLAKMIAAMWAVNENPNAVIWHPRTAGEMDQLVDSTGQPLRPIPSTDRLLKLQTASIPINLTQGSANDASDATLGDFSAAMIGMRTGLVVEVSRLGNIGATSLFSTLQVGIRGYLRADFQVARPAAFRVVAGIR